MNAYYLVTKRETVENIEAIEDLEEARGRYIDEVKVLMNQFIDEEFRSVHCTVYRVSTELTQEICKGPPRVETKREIMLNFGMQQ